MQAGSAISTRAEWTATLDRIVHFVEYGKVLENRGFENATGCVETKQVERFQS
jgi:hypothetical protein